ESDSLLPPDWRTMEIPFATDVDDPAEKGLFDTSDGHIPPEIDDEAIDRWMAEHKRPDDGIPDDQRPIPYADDPPAIPRPAVQTGAQLTSAIKHYLEHAPRQPLRRARD
ncbi:MAG: hypothetical protein ACRC1H_16900, partial [Caldilineaceae bacterium]